MSALKALQSFVHVRNAKVTTSDDQLEILRFGVQLRRAGAVAITKAVAAKASFQSLDLDSNEISEAAVDDIKVCLVPRLARLLMQHNLGVFKLIVH